MPALDATFESKTLVADDVAFFTFALDAPLVPPNEGQPAFRAGQYVTLGASGPDGALVRRPMTLTSRPDSPDRIECLLNRVAEPASEAPLSHLLFELQPGARVSVRPAATGRFTLEDCAPGSATRTVLVGFETGVAPFIAMVRSGRRLDDLTLVHVVTRSETAAARAEFEALCERGLRYTCLSPADLTPWLAEAALSPSEVRVLGCGVGSGLLALARALMPRGYVPPHRRLKKALGLPLEAPTTLHLEQYDAVRLFDTKDADLLEALRPSA